MQIDGLFAALLGLRLAVAIVETELNVDPDILGLLLLIAPAAPARLLEHEGRMTCELGIADGGLHRPVLSV